ncbi:hypothetical protein M9H77_36995 [Catharanthus roseus]|uniref:Uncharacterized protein n=1 Tax=Catharanthus roseus TaxID=4058 RepID=A0ACB9ZTS9_CATRO|nr:hypothetical protein M9H77_36995 [Catharanthus roseus]
MGFPQSPSSPPHLYSEELQLKLYQAFIFSIPILFSVILFLLFYLFYLKRRASNYSATLPILPRTVTEATSSSTTLLEMDLKLKRDLKNNLSTVLFDDDLKAKESLCCVCLGEFQMEEELLQVSACKHVFHIDCICHWLLSNSTCPLCRSSVLTAYPHLESVQSFAYSNEPSNN